MVLGLGLVLVLVLVLGLGLGMGLGVGVGARVRVGVGLGPLIRVLVAGDIGLVLLVVVEGHLSRVRERVGALESG